MAAAVAKRHHRLTAFSVWFLTIFLVLFPKGGVKGLGIPLTWGYFYLFLSAPFLIVVRLLARPLRMTRGQMFCLLLILPLQAVIVYSIYANGYVDVGFMVSGVTGLFVLPWMFVWVYSSFYPLINSLSLARVLRFSMLVAAIWGIFLFFWHPFTGHYIEIPYLTVNADDFGQLENTKHIARGFFFKLISTYNNGNLYGVCTLLLYPFWLLVEPSRWKRIVLRIAIILSLSRTVWIGIVLTEVFQLAGPLLRQIPTFPIVRLGEAGRRVAILLVSVGLILASLLFNSWRISFLFDKTFGGRDQIIYNAFSATLLPTAPFGGFQEIMYASALNMLGYVGLVAFVLWMISPLLVLAADPAALRSPFRAAAFRSLMLYAIIAGIDGGLNYIPVMAFYWFAWMVFLFGWPGGDLVPVHLVPIRFPRIYFGARRPLAPASAGAQAMHTESGA